MDAMEISCGRSRLRRLGPLMVALALALGCLGCTCTRIGCWDSATVVIQRAGSPLRLAARVNVDGNIFECPAPEADKTFANCGGNGVSLGFSGDDQRVELLGLAPARLTVTLLDGTTVVAERTFLPRYEKNTVDNGFACDNPTCKDWTETWNLP
jgi:hypothetical protein